MLLVDTLYTHISVGAADGESDADQAQAQNVAETIVRRVCITQMMVG